MSSEIAIKVENLSKCYHIYDQPRDRLKQMTLPRLQRAIGMQPRQYFREFWALKDVSFEVKKGETVGIIGRNGSGKSTLLQMICGTLNPSSGSIRTCGRIAALLELGAGFNPEFTGRDNVYLNGAVLGLSRDEVDARFDEIVTFAEIGDFIEQPVKTYSSGMMVRLAFAVAINVDPQILVVDEALSVGDELFQRKCFSRIENIRKAGATILFVSHAGGTVVELCERVLLVDSGERLAMGLPKQMVARYQKLLYAPSEKREIIREEIRRIDKLGEYDALLTDEVLKFNADKDQGLDAQVSLAAEEMADYYDPHLKPSSTVVYESYGAFIEDPAIYSAFGERVNQLTRGKTYYYRYRIRFDQPASNVRFGMLIKTTSGVELGGAVSAASNRKSLPFVTGGSVYEVEFAFVCRLNSGVYFLNAGVVGDLNGSETYLHRLIDVAMFRVNSELASLGTGIVDFNCVPKIETVSNERI
ncbi:TPA: ABC transporter ATP-binding protein [Pseudomonas aeruginosa]|uniref:ABC transporter ATP-binding protein n=1 Tax=Gammaproteobacteria TaxID=1236 RepID=UPI001C66B71D|nr:MULTISPECIES: ABC transporter ATP-binding protein [Gammaproteobacteria]MBW6121810.1 ABC transporter ATP-binding protein [Pseudomonas aeruginosa]HCF0111826.1 ABC transporter ATP-binding protein [Pseudomonas aeruginosa]HCF0589261.1 ABC transporter ATP-binding protein [Pseudomonas aeruginosa]HCK4505718.1 ABC transporter ATP-binding protein [Pseudomonas aeruginosa]HCK4576686.1 ABC transporter ATP-binding protein [Pseudomonas aeruginosa]